MKRQGLTRVQPPPGSAGVGVPKGSECGLGASCGRGGAASGRGELASGQEVRGRGARASQPSVCHRRMAAPQGPAQRLDPRTRNRERGQENRSRRAAAARERVRGSGGGRSVAPFLCSLSFSLTLLLFFSPFFFLFLEGLLRLRTRNAAQREL